MTILTLVIIVVLLMMGMLVIRVPVFLALGLSGAFGLWALRGEEFATQTLGSVPFTETSTFSLTIIPMFILMGMFAVKAKVAEQVYKVAAHAFRNFPGGLGVATVMACAGFAAVSGSSIGTAATMSRLSVGEMQKHGYKTSMATATVAVAGTLGVLIPPSVILVLYAIMTRESVAKVLAAGIIPGIISALAYALYIILASRRDLKKQQAKVMASALATASGETDSVGAAGGTGASVATIGSTGGWKELPMRGVVRVAILFFIVLGGMYSGIFTPTESAAMGALAAAVILVTEMYKEGWRATLGAITEALKETAGTTSMVFGIIVGSAVLSIFFVTARVPQMLTEAVLEAGWDPPAVGAHPHGHGTGVHLHPRDHGAAPLPGGHIAGIRRHLARHPHREADRDRYGHSPGGHQLLRRRRSLRCEGDGDLQGSHTFRDRGDHPRRYSVRLPAALAVATLFGVILDSRDPRDHCSLPIAFREWILT